MAAYLVQYHLRKNIRDLSPSEIESLWPTNVRVSATEVPRAISSVVNGLKANGTIVTKSDIKIVNCRQVV